MKKKSNDKSRRVSVLYRLRQMNMFGLYASSTLTRLEIARLRIAASPAIASKNDTNLLLKN